MNDLLEKVLDSPSDHYHFSLTSKETLSEIHPKLRLLCMVVILIEDVRIANGHRTRQEHEDFQRRGLTQVSYEQTKHSRSPSEAVHIEPYPPRYFDRSPKNLARFYHLAGVVKAIAFFLGIEIRWGGDWDRDSDFTDQAFDDLAHYEILL